MVGLPIIIDIHSGINADTEARMIAWLEARGNIVLADGRCLQGDLCITGDLEAPTGRGATYVVAAYNAPQHVKDQADFVCDGAADEVQMQAANDAAATVGGTVSYSEGTFVLAAAFNPSSNVHHEGQGTGATLWNCSALGNSIVAAADLQNAEFSGITFYRAGADYGVMVLSPIGGWAAHVDIHDCEFDNMRLFTRGNVTDINVYNNEFHDIVHSTTPLYASAIDLGDLGYQSYDITIKDNTLQAMQALGMVVQGASRVIISGNTITDTGSNNASAIDTSDCVNISVTGNVCTNSRNGFWSENSSGNITVIGNVFGGRAGGTIGYGAKILRTTAAYPRAANVVIANNAIEGFQFGIGIADAEDALVEGNSIRDIYQNPIQVTKDATWGVDPRIVRILDNTIYDFSQTAWSRGIYFDCDSVHIEQNYLNGANNTNSRGIGSDGTAFSDIRIIGNIIKNVTTVLHTVSANAVIERNTGYLTEGYLTGTIASGTTSIAVAHGLATTPTSVSFEPKEQGSNDYGRFWWSGNTTHVIYNVAGDPGVSNLDFSSTVLVR